MNDEYKQMSWEEIYEFNKKLDNMEHDYKNKCKQLEAYENMRKEAINFVRDKARNNCWIDQYEANDLLNILNKVGSDK